MTEDELLEMKAEAQRQAIGLPSRIEPAKVVRLVDEVLRLRDELTDARSFQPWLGVDDPEAA